MSKKPNKPKKKVVEPELKHSPQFYKRRNQIISIVFGALVGISIAYVLMTIFGVIPNTLV